jgi:tetratricopeptide (TPR) repeat protein
MQVNSQAESGDPNLAGIAQAPARFAGSNRLQRRQSHLLEEHVIKRMTLICGLVLALSTSALAGYNEAIGEYKQAMKYWKTDAAKCQKFLESALSQVDAKSTGKAKLLRSNLNLILGKFHQGKTGDFPAATKYYRTLLRENLGVKDPKVTNLKAQALLNLGTIFYSVKKDINEAVIKYQDAHKTYPTAQTGDVLSQILFRQARDPKTSKLAAKKKIDLSEVLARESIMVDEKNPNKRSTPALRAKYRLQLVIVLTARGKAEEAAKEWKLVDAKALGDTALYQLAQLAALRKAPAKEVVGLLQRANDPKLRPAPAARNQLRWFIRTEGDFAQYATDAGFKKLTEDEKETKR